MLHSYEPVVGAVALIVTLAVRAVTTNRLIRSKLRLALFAFAGHLAVSATVASGLVSNGTAARLLPAGHLLLALGAVTLVVVAAVNPWREDRTPEGFPNIVQDAIIIGVFLVVATAVSEEKFLTTSAVGAVVIGFALQDTLGNMFAGLAIQVEKPFRVGHWIRIGSYEGRVVGITWRATRLETRSGDAVVVPNNIVSKEAIWDFSEPAAPTKLAVEVGASYRTPPNEVKAVIADALADAALVLPSPPSEVVVADFGPSAIVYRVKFWTADYAADDTVRDQVRTCIYYAFKRRGIEIPYPAQVTYTGIADEAAPVSAQERETYLAAVDAFAPLSPGARARLAAVSRERLYGTGQTVVREGQPGASMFVVGRGSVRVVVGRDGTEVARIPAGGYFGEMSLLTGEPRTATVSAATDCLLFEIDSDDFRGIALADPAVVEQVTAVVAERRAGLERTRLSAAATGAVTESPRGFLLRVRQFLRL